MKTITITAAAAILGFAAAPTFAGDDWVGLFRGFDPATGAEVNLSIAPMEDDIYPIVVVTSQHSQCDGSAFMTADGTLNGQTMVRENTMLSCSSGVPAPTDNAVYLIDRDEEMISGEVPADGRAIHYFRIGGDS